MIQTVPDQLIQPRKVMQLVEGMLGESHEGRAIPLARLEERM